MQTPIHIIIHGLVILLAGSMLNSTPSVNVFGALAVEDNMRPEVPMVSSYGVTLPIHDAMLTIAGNSAVAVGGLNQGRLQSITDADLGPRQFIALSGDRIQFGNYNDSACTPTPIEGATGAVPGAHFEEVPHLSRFVSDMEMLPNTRPVSGNYSSISPSLVSAWLDVPQGALTAHTAPEANFEKEFRPSRRKQIVATEALLDFNGQPDIPVCIIVTPFGAGEPDVVIKLPVRPQRISIDFANMARPRTTGAVGEIVPGITYDFELFYRVLRTLPCPAPVPYFDPKKAADLAKKHGHVNSETDPPEGAICGPGYMQ